MSHKASFQTPFRGHTFGGGRVVVLAVLVTSAVAPVRAAEPLVLPESVQPVAESAVEGSSADASAACCTTAECCCQQPCCRVRGVCCCTTEKESVDKYCWQVGCEDVCIPPVCLPKFLRWLPLCGRGCAACRVRSVSTLEKHEYECTECRCQWQVRYVPCCPAGAGCPGGTASSAIGAPPPPVAGDAPEELPALADHGENE